MGSVPFFKWTRMPYALRVLGWSFGKMGPIQGHVAVVTCWTFWVGAWQFYWYQSRRFSKTLVSFSESSGYRKIYLAVVKLGNFYSRMPTIQFHCRMDPPPPWREQSRPRIGEVDEKVASAPYNFLLAPELRVWPNLKPFRCYFRYSAVDIKLGNSIWGIASELEL